MLVMLRVRIMCIFTIVFVMAANHLSVPMVLSDPGKFKLSEDEKQKLEGKLQPLSLSGFPRQLFFFFSLFLY